MNKYSIIAIFILLINVSYAQITWHATSFNQGGSVYALITANDGSLIAGKDDKIFRSTDGGDTWTQIASNLLTDINCFVKIPSNGYLFAGCIEDSDGGGVWRSLDNGKSWTQLKDTKGIRISTMTVNSNGIIFVGTRGTTTGIRWSSDYGNTWPSTAVGLSSCDIYSLTSDNKGNVYAATGNDGALYKSPDGGTSWYRIYYWGIAQTAHAVAITDSGILFVVVTGNGFISGLLRSNDNGSTWNLVLPNAVNFYEIPQIIVFSDTELFCATGDGIFHTSDGGVNWDAINTGLPNSIYCMTIDNSNYLYAGTNSSIFKSDFPIKSDPPIVTSCLNLTTIPDLNQERIRSQAEAYNNEIYCFGGYYGYNVNNTMEIFNGQSWSNGTNMLQPRAEFASCVLNGGIYVFGGLTSFSNVTDNVEFYNGKDWSSKGTIANSKLPIHDMDGAVIDNSFYIFGGVQNTSGSIEYDTIIRKFTPPSSWESLGALSSFNNHFTPRSGYKCVAVGDTIFIIGGAHAYTFDSAANYYNDVWKFIPSRDTLIKGNSLNIKRADFAAGALNGKIYIAGGVNDSIKSPTNTMEVYDPGTGLWSLCANSPSGILSPASTVLNDNLYILGGDSSHINYKKCYGKYFPPDGVSNILKKKIGVRIYPNPIEDNFTIEIDSEIKNSILEIYNMFGEKCLTKEINHNKQTFICQNLPSGIYFYQLKRSTEIIETGKIVIE
jgi:photosystem II stability/assembly factor-like uncharacterized protein/N-acetylneuraminic acid mutarotase